MTYEWESPICLHLLRKRAGFRYRYYPNCEASVWLCQLLHRRSLTQGQIEGLRRFLGMQIDIEIESKS